MGVSYNRLWKMLIDKNMKRIEMQYLTGISGNILARMLQKLKKITRRILHKSLSGANPGFEKSQSGKYSENRYFVQGEFPLATQVPIPEVCD